MADFVIAPLGSAILITIILLAMLVEVKTGGLGVGAFIGVVTAIVFFSNHWLAGTAGWLEIGLFMIGVLLIIFELYTPGFGFFAVAGVIFVFASIILALGGGQQAITVLAISLVVAVGIFAAILKRLPSNHFWSKVVLRDTEASQAGFVSGQSYDSLLGQEAITVTPLRPAGVIEITGRQLHAVSEGGYVDNGSRVKIIEVTGSRIVVKRVLG